jgi:hypothetical protein
LPSHALGQVTFNMLCPSGKDDWELIFGFERQNQFG